MFSHNKIGQGKNKCLFRNINKKIRGDCPKGKARKGTHCECSGKPQIISCLNIRLSHFHEKTQGILTLVGNEVQCEPSCPGSFAADL